MTSKIVDNTFISACIGEINCIDLLGTCSQHYNIVTTKEVFDETKRGFETKIVSKVYNIISIHSQDPELYFELKDWLENRYPALHEGEVSTFLLALLSFSNTGLEYYYVTDDRRMKDVIREKLPNDEIFLKKLGSSFDITNFNVTGTAGITRRLIEKGVIKPEYIEPIISEMDDNGFYLSEEVKNYLRGI